MNQIITTAIILRRTDYGEADRILTLLTPDHGKIRLMAKGVRRVKSKLAGGIELFSVSKISYLAGRRDIGTLVSSQLVTHYGTIVTRIDRTMLGYDLIKQLDRTTEDETEADYFTLMHQAFAGLNEPAIPLGLVRSWFTMQLLRLGGHMPNLLTDTDNHKLAADQQYVFDADNMAFAPRSGGPFTANHIKFLRLGFSGNQPAVLSKVQQAAELLEVVAPIVQAMAVEYLPVVV